MHTYICNRLYPVAYSPCVHICDQSDLDKHSFTVTNESIALLHHIKEMHIFLIIIYTTLKLFWNITNLYYITNYWRLFIYLEFRQPYKTVSLTFLEIQQRFPPCLNRLRKHSTFWLYCNNRCCWITFF